MSHTTTAAPRLVFVGGTVQVPAELVYRAGTTLMTVAHFLGEIDQHDSVDEILYRLDDVGEDLCALLLKPGDPDALELPDPLRDPVVVEAHAHAFEKAAKWVRTIQLKGDPFTEEELSERALGFEKFAAEIRATGHAFAEHIDVAGSAA